VRLRRLTNLLRVAQARVAASVSDASHAAQLGEILRQIEQVPASDPGGVARQIDRANERAAFSLELFDLETWTLRPLASALNFSNRVDPALVRFTLRLTVLMIFGVVISSGTRCRTATGCRSRSSWCLQPDYGSTRQRAAQRVAGTFAAARWRAGCSGCNLPFPALAVAMAVTIFTFGYFVRRN